DEGMSGSINTTISSLRVAPSAFRSFRIFLSCGAARFPRIEMQSCPPAIHRRWRGQRKSYCGREFFLNVVPHRNQLRALLDQCVRAHEFLLVTLPRTAKT